MHGSCQQGFAWRKGSVSFAVSDIYSTYKVYINSEVELTDVDTKICVPFEVWTACEFGSTHQTFDLNLDVGRYALTASIKPETAEIYLNYEKSDKDVKSVIIKPLDFDINYPFFMDEDSA